MTETTRPRNKLFLMMVMEFFIWGAWLPLIFSYLPSLGFSPIQQAWILNAFPISAIIGMAILGLGFTRAFWPFFLLMVVHCLLYVPTLSIVNSIAFAHMKDSRK